MNAIAVASCAVHPGAPALFACERCGRFTCGACVAPDRRRCHECFAWSERRISPRAYALVALGLIAMFGVLPAAPAVLVFARAERRAIETGESPSGGTDVVTSAQWMAWITLAAWGVPLVIYGLWWLAGHV